MDDDDDIIILDSPSPPQVKSKLTVESIHGIPTFFASDTMKRFSFGASLLSRRSLSQPNLNNFDISPYKEEKELELSTQAAALLSPPRKGRPPKLRTIQKEFFGVYCLISRSAHKSHKNRCYIGYTVDPTRRINQHNGGTDKGGAKKTDSRGPWDMVCIVHGFPNNVAALRFEWAWQNPDTSKAIRHLNLKKLRKETPFAFRLRIACHLMNCNPWKRFALTFRWLIPAEELPFPEEIKPPVHIGKEYGLVTKSTVTLADEELGYTDLGKCSICAERIAEISHLARCLRDRCAVHFHLRCIATYGQGNEKFSQLFPVRISCPKCYGSFLWGDVVRDQNILLKVAESNEENVKLRGLVLKGIH